MTRVVTICEICILTINLVPRFQKVPKSDLHRQFSTIKIFYWRASIYSDAASGWEGWALARSEFGSSVNPITTKGADYAHHITASPPRFENPGASLI